METNKVSVLLATYNPNIGWLEELLVSLENQTYSDYEVIVYDDCSDSVNQSELEAAISKNLKNTPYKVYRGKKNLGSNFAFQKLIEYADGKYVSFCDQDDVWHCDKIEKSVTCLEKSCKTLVCSDVSVIDKDGNKAADSITAIRKRHNLYPENQLNYLTYENFVIGCTVLMRTADAAACLPFFDAAVHDHQLALYAALKNGIEVIKEPTLDYRIHGDNQTGVLCKITDKKSYFDYKIKPFEARICDLKTRYSYPELDRAALWAQARIDNFNRKKGSFFALKKLKNVNRSKTLFELYAFRIPFAFRIALKFIKKGVL